MSARLGWPGIVSLWLACSNPPPARPTTPTVIPLTGYSCPTSVAALRTLEVNPATGDDAATGECETTATCAPWKTLTWAAAHVHPGDRVLLRAGTYSEDVSFTQSGSAAAPIVFEAAPGEAVILPRTVTLAGKSYLEFRGLQFDAPKGDAWFDADADSHDLRVIGSTFDSHSENRAAFVGLGLKGKHHLVCGNVFGSWLGDLLSADPVDGLLVENNDFSQASGMHALLTLVGRNAVIRGNAFRNPWQRVIHISDRSADKRSEDILIEDNTFIDSDWSTGGPNPSNEEQFRGGAEVVRFLGARGIFRNNLLVGSHEGNNWECHGILNFQTFNNTAVGIDQHRYTQFRVSGNTFDSNRTNSVIFYQGPTGELTDNQFKNNVISGAEKFAITACNSGVPWKTYRFERNLLPGPSLRFPEMAAGGLSVALAEAAAPTVFIGNLGQAPIFTDAGFGATVAADFTGYRLARLPEAFNAYTLAPGSAGKGQAVALTTVVAATTDAGTVQVEDALWFSDGFGQTEGDLIRIGASPARVVGRDLTLNVLTLDRPVTSAAGAAVTLVRAAAANDLGVHLP